MTQSKIVILERDQRRRDYLRWMLTDLGYIPFTFEKETSCLDNLSRLEPDMVISGPLSRERAYRFINTVKMIDWRLQVLMISGDHTIKDFINSNGFGDVTVISSDFDHSKIKGILTRILNSRTVGSETVNPAGPLIVGDSQEIKNIKSRIPRLGRMKDLVLIQGETGTGKELVARAIHAQSNRRDHPFVKVNLPELTSEKRDEVLFEVHPDKLRPDCRQKSSIFAAAQKGTLFLGGIGSIPVSQQGMLIDFFENDVYLNSRNAVDENGAIDVRLVVSSSRGLELLVDSGKFRKDLYFRLSAVSVEMPPLRDRVTDIPLLTDYFVDKFCIELGRVHYEFSKNTKEAFCKYHWPGNVSELKHLVKSAVLNSDEDSIFVNLPARVGKSGIRVLPDQVEDIYKLAGLDDLRKNLKDLEKLSLKSLCRKYSVRTEKKIIKKALEHTNWNRKKASELLNISYKSLLTKIKTYRLR
jgi:two-component system response regulator AtoC